MTLDSRWPRFVVLALLVGCDTGSRGEYGSGESALVTHNGITLGNGIDLSNGINLSGDVLPVAGLPSSGRLL